ncbi:MAG: hypothetical protein VX278_13940, partial [Myxococcota bacterium]|nr:hypothetical protein [Myxococcota bacterium]
YRSLPTNLREGQHLIFVNGLEFPAMYSAMLPIVREDDVHPPVAILSASPDATLTVTGSHELDIDMPQGWFTQMMLFGPTKAFAVGDRIKRPGFEAIVQAVNAEHEPTRVRFVFEESIDGDRYRWMKWVGNRYEEIERSSLSKEPLYIPSPLPFDP